MTKKIKGYATSTIRATQPGWRFNMDYGFVRGEVVIKKESVPLITSKEGYNYYLLTVDTYGFSYLLVNPHRLTQSPRSLTPTA